MEPNTDAYAGNDDLTLVSKYNKAKSTNLLDTKQE